MLNLIDAFIIIGKHFPFGNISPLLEDSFPAQNAKF